MSGAGGRISRRSSPARRPRRREAAHPIKRPLIARKLGCTDQFTILRCVAMFRIRSMSTRLVLAISATTIGASLLLGTFFLVEQRADAEASLDQQLELQYKSVVAALEYEGRAARAVGTVIAGLPPIQEALRNDDRAALGALLGPGFGALKAAGVPLLTFTKPPATTVYRVHDPKGLC